MPCVNFVFAHPVFCNCPVVLQIYVLIGFGFMQAVLVALLSVDWHIWFTTNLRIDCLKAYLLACIGVVADLVCPHPLELLLCLLMKICFLWLALLRTESDLVIKMPFLECIIQVQKEW